MVVMLVFGVVLTAMTAWFVVVSVREVLWLRGVRRTGRRITGEVVDNEARNRSYYGGYLLYPVVRYELDGKQYRGTVRNWQGKIELGSGLPLLVDPEDPYSPAVADRDSLGRGLAISLFMLAVALLLTYWGWQYRNR
ncbi:DUF3592 domain-containing protein [Kribbella sp. NPDC059898]|uniref:DUF3592 domain-containing protein n=1 Tax=Kribbella sp. NPDC059898 TaxID=3346995 RepID=UPI00364FB7ED